MFDGRPVCPQPCKSPNRESNCSFTLLDKPKLTQSPYTLFFPTAPHLLLLGLSSRFWKDTSYVQAGSLKTYILLPFSGWIRGARTQVPLLCTLTMKTELPWSCQLNKSMTAMVEVQTQNMIGEFEGFGVWGWQPAQARHHSTVIYFIFWPGLWDLCQRFKMRSYCLSFL